MMITRQFLDKSLSTFLESIVGRSCNAVDCRQVMMAENKAEYGGGAYTGFHACATLTRCPVLMTRMILPECETLPASCRRDLVLL